MENLEPVLAMLLEVCQRSAIRIPTPGHPPESEWVAAADDYVRHSAKHERFRKISPEIAAALIPRILAAQRHAHAAQEQLDTTLGREATTGELLEELLFTRWHSSLQAEWARSH